MTTTNPISRWRTFAGEWYGGDVVSPEAGRVRAAQIHAVARYSPLTMTANLINAAVVVAVVRQTANPWVLACWGIIVLTMVVATTRAWFLQRARKPRKTASVRAIRRATHHAAVLASIWALVPILWFRDIGLEGQLVIACLVTGMICAGGFALSTIPSAAYAYVTILALGAAYGLGETGNGYMLALTVLLSVYAAIVVRSVAGSAQLFRDQFLAEARLKERGEIIELLLNEFEQNSSDWLFETDTTFTVTSHSPRFAEVCGRSGESLAGVQLQGLAEPQGRAALDDKLARCEPFRDLDLRVNCHGTPRWWTLTAKPLYDEDSKLLGWRGVGSDVTEARQASEKVAWMARTDMLTGLPNRTRFRELAAMRLEIARRNGSSFALGCLDLDQFKTVNDTLGHPVGDALLTDVARELSHLAGEGVIFGRIGGDEFGMLVTDFARRGDVLALAQRIINEVGRSKVVRNARITIGTSIGIAFSSGESDTIDDLIRNADLALYRAKDAGRGTAVVFDDTMHREAEERRLLQEDLRLALDGGQLRIGYQPIVSVRQGDIIGFEALVRWHHPERGLLLPSTFIALAEETGLIESIGAWVLRQACSDAMTWPAHMRVAVNISPAQFGSAALLNHVAEALAASGLLPDRLELEITEALFMNHLAESDGFLRDMRALGVRIALDDFGTGFSSLGYLTRFPIQKLKIDRSFVSGATDFENRKAVVEAIVGIAKSLHFETTAEGVETAEDLAWVRSLGCDQAQGYHFSKALPIDHVGAFILGFGNGSADAPATTHAA
ncbi:EAL domain-containing protein [Phreatobacter aquaticus]|uniref:EAL domain-containing protein n=1 Tax=Phreatobacter aquaticus TaxID=2570229 RepID=A0A4D7QJH5_9HYPH|nr:GGDEF and EAL domain-containing protein [Phreatobacter aquaticus]QCK85879.1 EAL domain-containing protein [Phreatobacter aquaticus]